MAAAGHTFWKLDRSNGAILASQEQPIEGTPAIDHNFDGMVVAPDAQGTLLIKSQTRAVGCSTQTNNAMSSCSGAPGANPKSVFVAVDPTTLKNLDSIQIDQNVTARTVAVQHNGKIYIYGNGANSLVRVIWNPVTQKLTQDKSWEPKVILKGETGGASPTVVGNWVIADSNANPSTTTPQCIFAVNQDNPNDVHHICPWGDSFPVASGATTSETPAAPGADPENSLIFVDDYFLKGVYAIHLDQQTGEMKVQWSRPDWWSSDYFSMTGPANQRVLIEPEHQPKHDDGGHRHRLRLHRERPLGERGDRQDDRPVRGQPVDGARKPDQRRLRRPLLHDGQRRLAVHLPGRAEFLGIATTVRSHGRPTAAPQARSAAASSARDVLKFIPFGRCMEPFSAM